MFKKIASILLIILLAILFTFCDEKTNKNETIAKEEKNNTEITLPATAVVYVYDSFDDSLKEDIKTYISKNHNVEVNFEVFEDTGPMVATIITEKDNPKADLVIGIDNSFGLEILKSDVLDAYNPASLNLAFDELNFDKSNRLIPYDYGYISINYDSERLKELPTTFDDLTKERYKRNIAIMSPLTSSPGRIFLFETIARYGADGYIDFWRRLKPSITNITSGWSDAYYGLYVQGESDMVVSYTTSPPVHMIYDKTDKYKSLIFNNEAYIQIEASGIIKNAKNRPIAEKIIDYIVSKEFQDKICEKQFMFPINPEAQIPEIFVQYAQKPVKTLILDSEIINNNIEKWLKDWENTMLK